MTHQRQEHQDDHELVRLFRELREAEARQAPDFEEILAHPRTSSEPAPRLPRRRLVLAAAALLVTVAVAWLLYRPTPDSQPVSDSQWAAMPTSWEAPSDFLLRTPGSELLSAPRWEDSWPELDNLIDDSILDDPYETDSL